MPLVNTSLPNLIQGVSQQPDAVRYDGQCEEQTNAISSVVDGLSKRPNTRHLAKILSSTVSANSFVHFVDRSDAEKYVVIHDGYTLKAFNLDGTPCTINGASSYTTSSSPYLNSSVPKEELKALTVGDTTFLLNKNYPVSSSPTLTPALEKLAVVTIKQGDYLKNYRVEATVTPHADFASNVTLPTFTFNTTAYQYQYSGVGAGQTRYYRHRITSVNITNAGQNIPSDATLSIAVTSSLNIYTHPQFTVNVSNGVVTSVTVTNQGNFEGSGQSGNDFYTTPPTITASVSGVLTGAVTELHAKIRSGTSANSANNNANSDIIARDLRAKMQATEDSDNTDHHISSGNWQGSGTSGFFTINEGLDNGNLSNNIYLELKDSQNEFSIRTTDSLANTGMSAAYKQVDSITDLPVENKNGFRIKVRGAAEVNEDDYYVQFESNQGRTYSDGVYNETVGFGISEGVKNSSMPHLLKLTALNTFTLGEGTYTTRVAGDDDTNPQPSFVDSQINSMFFFKNRLGFLSEDRVIMSEAGEPFNFFRTTVTTLLDSDPIDVQVSSQKVTNLQSATGFQENLILFSENSQFVLKGGDLLTPRTVSVTPVTNFDAASLVNPIPLGAYMYFPFESRSFTGVREYTVNASTDVYDSAEITEHIPTYIPKDVFMFVGSSTEDALAMVSQNEKGSIFVYRFFFNGQKKLLSSWFKFTLDGEIRGISFSKSDLFIVLTKNNETHLLSIPFDAGLTDDGEKHATLLDMRKRITLSAGDTTIDLSSFYLPDDNTIQVYKTDGTKLAATNVGAIVTLQNPAEAGDVFVGIPYKMVYKFSKQVFKQNTGQGKSPSNGKMLIRNGSVYFNNTFYFKVLISPTKHNENLNTYENVYNPNIVGSSLIGNLNLDDGFYRFPVFSKTEDTDIIIENDSALPSNFQSAEFESFVHSRSRRVG